MIAMTGMRMSGKMSTGVRSAASGPTIRIVSASTINVYGRRNAMRTIPSMPRTLPSHETSLAPPPTCAPLSPHWLCCAAQSSSGIVSDFGRFVQLPRRERWTGGARQVAARTGLKGSQMRLKCRQKWLVDADRFDLMAGGVARRFRKAVRDCQRRAVGGVQDEHRQAGNELRRLRIEDFGLFGAHLP